MIATLSAACAFTQAWLASNPDQPLMFQTNHPSPSQPLSGHPSPSRLPWYLERG